MLKLDKYVVPLYAGDAKKGILHVAVVDSAGYIALQKLIDKNDAGASEWWPFDSFAGLAYCRLTKDKRCDYWMIFPVGDIKHKHRPKKITANTIVHECMHIAGQITANTGIRHDITNDEPYAYLIGWVAECAFNTCKRFVKL